MRKLQDQKGLYWKSKRINELEEKLENYELIQEEVKGYRDAIYNIEDPYYAVTGFIDDYPNSDYSIDEAKEYNKKLDRIITDLINTYDDYGHLHDD